MVRLSTRPNFDLPIHIMPDRYHCIVSTSEIKLLRDELAQTMADIKKMDNVVEKQDDQIIQTMTECERLRIENEPARSAACRQRQAHIVP